MSLLPTQLQGLAAIPQEVAARAQEEFSELPGDLRKRIIDAAAKSNAALQALRRGDWVKLRSALLRIHLADTKAGYDKLANEILGSLG